MGSSKSMSKGTAMSGSKLPKVGMASPKSSNVSKGNAGGATTSYSNMKK